MLVLSRFIDEQILIGNDVVITIVEVRGNKVRVGIDAPQNIKILRKEVLERIKNEQIHNLQP